MNILIPKEINTINSALDLVKKYDKTIDRESVYELLTKKIEAIETEEAKIEKEKERARISKTSTRTSSSKIKKSVTRSAVKTLTIATFMRDLLGILKKVMR